MVRPIHSLSYAVSGRNGALKIVALSTLETSAVRSSVRVKAIEPETSIFAAPLALSGLRDSTGTFTW